MTIELPLNRELVALIDDDDAERVMQYKWFTMGNSSRTMYAVRGFWFADTKIRKTVLLHRFIMNAPKGIYVDHINHCTLDCRKSNLRLVTQSQNLCNQVVRSGHTSVYKGVSWASREKKWQSQIKLHGHHYHIGYFKSELEAALAYDKRAHELFGEFCLPNFKCPNAALQV